MNGRDFGMLTALAAIWGLSFVFIRVASPALGPFLLVELRVGIAAVVIAAIVLARGSRAEEVPRIRGSARPYLVLAVINAAIPFTLISAAELVLPASVASIVNATVPLFTAVFSALWLADPLTRPRSVGLTLGFAGVVIVVGGGSLTIDLPDLLAVGASLAGAVSYALGAIYIRRTFRGTTPMALTLGQELVAAALLLPLATATASSAHWSGPVVASAVGLAVLSTAVAYLVYFDLLARVGPTRSTSVTFLVPVFGIVWSRLLLGEPVGYSLVLGLAVILVGVALVTRSGPSDAPSTGSGPLDHDRSGIRATTRDYEGQPP